MSNNFIIPDLADIQWHQPAHIPPPFLLDWYHTDRSPLTQQKILKDYIVAGTIVNSDSSGFTALSEKTHVLELTLLIHRPKEIIYSYGKAIGGVPIGIWRADNTSMFYPEDVPIEKIINQMAAAQHAIGKQCKVEVSMGIYQAAFTKIDDQFVGNEYQLLESITEDELSPQEIVIIQPSEAAMDFMKSNGGTPKPLGNNIVAWSLDYAHLGMNISPQNDKSYPKPFSDSFLKKLINIDFSDASRLNDACADMMKDTHVCFLNLHLDRNGLLLDRLLLMTVIDNFFQQSVINSGVEVAEDNGDSFVLLCREFDPLFDFLKKFCDEIKKLNIHYSAGIARSVILCETTGEQKSRPVAGMAINVASKLAEDVGETDHLLVHEDVFSNIAMSEPFTSFHKSTSHVVLDGWKTKI